MNDIKFNCPHCGQHVVCDAEAAGSAATCPACMSGIVVPHAVEQITEVVIAGTDVESAPEHSPVSISRRLCLVIGTALAIVLGVSGILLFKDRSKVHGPFEHISWFLTSSYTANGLDRATTYSITDQGKAEGLCYLVVQCQLVPASVVVDQDEDHSITDSFQLLMPDDTTNAPSVATTMMKSETAGPTNRVTEFKGAILFTVKEADARDSEFAFVYRHYPAIRLNKGNHSNGPIQDK